MSDIESWLDQYDLGKYAKTFAENDIRLDVLPDLDREDLKDLGVSLGDSKRLLRAIQALTPKGLAHDAPEDPSPDGYPASGDAERRQLTVMFCDLVGSVELGERLDVEDYRDLLALFRSAVVGSVERYEGFVARHQGDGLLVYFGYPQAHENDTERAVRAGLETVRTVKELAHPYDAVLKVRVGIATGPAIVGDTLATGASGRGERAALGPTPNLAARLQGEAEPNSVLVSETTGRLIEGLFESELLGALDLKGIDKPVMAYRVLDKEQAETRSEALAASLLSPLVGRQGELGLILGRWEQASHGAGQGILVSADPGVGKTRLLHELRERLALIADTTITLYCSPHHTGSVLHPVIEAINRATALGAGESPELRLPKFDAWLKSLDLADDRHLPLLAGLLSVPADDLEPLALSAAETRRQTLDMLAAIVEAMSRQQPMLFVAEDLHWSDPTTLELLELILTRTRHARVLVMLTFRPEFRTPWPVQPHLTGLTLNHLTDAECRQLTKEVAGEHVLPEDVLTRIVERTDGVPLFVEELLRTVLESGDEGRAGERVPETLRDALTARLDRLGYAKPLAQLAAVIGRQFQLEWLAAIAGMDEVRFPLRQDSCRL